MYFINELISKFIKKIFESTIFYQRVSGIVQGSGMVSVVPKHGASKRSLKASMSFNLPTR